MQLHELKRHTKNKKKKLVGRGGTRGKTSGRGTKGQNARAGHKKRPELRDIIKKLPKLRGYKFKSTETKPEVVNLSRLNNVFEDGANITPASLLEKRIIRRTNGKTPAVKILGNGEVDKKFFISGCLLSKTVLAKIEKAGGKVS
jgi:large subunit ribosomal protein L15